MKCKICNEGNLVEKFDYDAQISYYNCPNCEILTRIPDQILIDYYNDYMDNDKISKSKSLANYYYKKFRNIIPQNSICLEIGGSFGFFSKLLAENNNCTVRNIELSKYCSDYANRIGVKTFNNYEDLDINQFDFVFSFHVIEHIEPNKISDFVNQSLKYLKPGGKFILLTPNASSSKIYLLKKYYGWLAVDEHICFQSEKSMQYLLNHEEYIVESTSQIPAFVHYPAISLIASIRRKLIKGKVSSNNVNSKTKPKINLKSVIINAFKATFRFSIWLERVIIFPFYYIYDLFHHSKDELVIEIYKKIPEKIQH